MNKTIGIFSTSVMIIALFTVFAAAQAEKFCTESGDSGIDIWTPGIATDAQGANADDCDGASENLKEFACENDQAHPNNIKCSDYNAVCVTYGDKTVPDRCECPQGYAFNGETCVEKNDGGDGNGGKPVPEFSLLSLGLAIVGVGLGLALLRKK